MKAHYPVARHQEPDKKAKNLYCDYVPGKGVSSYHKRPVGFAYLMVFILVAGLFVIWLYDDDQAGLKKVLAHIQPLLPVATQAGMEPVKIVPATSIATPPAAVASPAINVQTVTTPPPTKVEAIEAAPTEVVVTTPPTENPTQSAIAPEAEVVTPVIANTTPEKVDTPTVPETTVVNDTTAPVTTPAIETIAKEDKKQTAAMTPAPVAEKAITTETVTTAKTAETPVVDTPKVTQKPAATPEAIKTAEKPEPQNANGLRDLKITVRRGHTLSTLFQAYGLSRKDLFYLTNMRKYAYPLTHLKPKQVLRMQVDKKGNIHSLVLGVSLGKELQLSRTDNPDKLFKAKLKSIPLDKGTKTITGKIRTSLSIDGSRAGLEFRQIQKLIEIFEPRLNFARQLKKGDQFTVYLDEFRLDGKLVKTGDIVAAEIINKGKIYQAIRRVSKRGTVSYRTSVYTLDE